jgi:hypothetical protein
MMLEFDHVDDFSVEWLQENNYKAHFFGLGFIQVKLNDYQRLHFYHPDLPAFVEDMHDHRYHFVSKVLRGCLSFELWDTDIVDGVTWTAEFESCKEPDAESTETIPPEFVQLSYLGKYEVCSGSSYYMNMNTFHTVKPKFDYGGPCVTFLTRTQPQKPAARVIRGSGEKICPFSQPISDDRLWALVRECCYG